MFDHIIGNEPLKNTLSRLRAADRLPNSMLFAGPDGVGKKLFALELARSFVCRTGPDACGECPACLRAGRMIMPGADDRDSFKKLIFSEHPDVGMVAAHNRFIFVDAIRNLESEAYFRPYEGEARTFIIDEAEKMNDAASNALLKTLEEPPATSRIILTTSRPDALLSTIRSRCQMFRFAPIAAEQVARYLIEDRGMSEPDARLAARMSGGSLGAAAAMDMERVRERRRELADVVRLALVRGDRAALLRGAERLTDAKNKDFLEGDVRLLLSMLHDVWLMAIGGDEASLVHADIAPDLREAANSSDPGHLARLMREVEVVQERFAVNINRKLAFDDLFLKMAA